MLGLNADGCALRLKRLGQDVRRLVRHTFLHLWTPAKALNRAGQLADTYHTARRDVGDMHRAKERQKVMLTDRHEGNILNRHHIPDALFVRDGQKVSRILINTGKKFGIHRRHALRRPFKAGASRIVSYGTEDFFNRAAYALLINHSGIDGRSNRLPCSVAH